MRVLDYDAVTALLSDDPAHAEIVDGGTWLDPEHLRGWMIGNGWYLGPADNPTEFKRWLDQRDDPVIDAERVFCRAVYYFTARRPDWDRARLGGAADQLCTLATGCGSPYVIEDKDPRWQWAGEVLRSIFAETIDGATPAATARLALQLIETLYSLPLPSDDTGRASVLIGEAIGLLDESRANFKSKKVAQAREILERLR